MWVIAVILDEKSMYTLSIFVPVANVTVIAFPAGYQFPLPLKSPIPTKSLLYPTFHVRPCSASTLSMTPLANITSTVIHVSVF